MGKALQILNWLVQVSCINVGGGRLFAGGRLTGVRGKDLGLVGLPPLGVPSTGFVSEGNIIAPHLTSS